LEVDRGAVVYFALEGAHGAKNRMAALRRNGQLKPGDPFYLVFDAVSLLEPGHADRLAATVAAITDESGIPVKLVIIDTMARAMAGGDENSGADMTLAVKAIDAVRSATGAHVAIVHHCGKDQAKGARGHSSLRAAVDTEIEVFRPENETVSTVRVTKQRDLQAGEAMPFSLKVIELGTDRRGKPITSCVVHHESSVMAFTPKDKSGGSSAASVAQLLSLLPQTSTTAWQKVGRSEFGIRESTFYRLLKGIRQSRAASSSKAEGWRVAEPKLGSEFA
jgi:RecA-family ATPase